MAQDDPFGSYDPYQWGNNMSLTGYVRMNGEILGNETVVAAYCGDELRGKDHPMDDGDKKSILYLDIYGDIKGEKLHFKVYTGGRVIEVDQGLTFTANGLIGFDDTYYIDLPAPVVTTGCIFTGATEPTAVAANSVLTLGYSNEGNHEIGFWRFTGTTIPANRAYITDFPAGSRGVTFRMDDETGISDNKRETINNKRDTINNKRAATANDRCYDLQGRQIGLRSDASVGNGARNRQLRSGLYITNGRKVVIK